MRHASRNREAGFTLSAYELGERRATGVLTIEPRGAPPELVLVRGGEALTSDLDALGRHVSAKLARFASCEGARFSFHDGAVEGGQRTFSLARWARQQLERQLDAAGSERLVREIGDAEVSLDEGATPSAGLLDTADRRLLAALARPRKLRDIASVARVPQYRLLTFLHFLRAVGALSVVASAPRSGVRATNHPPPRQAEEAAPRAAAFQLLGLPVGADGARVRKAFKSLAHAWHPDRHPEAGEARRRELERRIATLTAAYAELTA